jgi:dTDP-4-amino-4,6-dideoxygalactose transaminase
MKIPFNKAAVTKKEHFYISEVLASGVMAGDGPKGKACERLLSSITGCKSVLLTPSCTAALEMAAILCGVKPDDEVIVPSYTFVSSASSFVLRGAKIVFVDVDASTMNICLDAVEKAITPKTKVVVPVHYAGVSCDMERLMELSRKHGFYVVEDAAQALMSTYRGRALGTIGHLGCFSFHETKNYTAGGEGGALLVNDESMVSRAEVIREKGTDRKAFFSGQVDKYTWRDLGSSFLMSELQAAYLLAQLESAEEINRKRVSVWETYNGQLSEVVGFDNVLSVPSYNTHNAHLYYLKFPGLSERSKFISYMRDKGIYCPFHYVPLHSSPFGSSVGSFFGDDLVTTAHSERLVRLPIFFNLLSAELDYVINACREYLESGIFK